MTCRFLVSLALLFLCFLRPAAAEDNGVPVSAQPEEEAEEEVVRFVERVRLFEDDHQGSLIVFFDPDTVDRLSRSLQLRVYDETAFDPDIKAFVTRPVGLITGPGLNPGGLRFDPANPTVSKEFADLLERFFEEAMSLQRNLLSLQRQEEPWMAGNRQALSGKRAYGEFLFDFRRRPSVLEATWDLDLERFSLVVDRQYIIDYRLAPGIILFLRNLPAYLEKRGELLDHLAKARERSGDFFTPSP